MIARSTESFENEGGKITGRVMREGDIAISDSDREL